MARKSRFEDLSSAQQNRYLGAGRTGSLTGTPGLSRAEVIAYYEGGGYLGAARGHATPERKQALRQKAPQAATERMMAGFDTADDYKDLQRWRLSNAPAWIPRADAVMGLDTAAALSQIGAGPKQWREVDFDFLADGRVRMNVTTRGGSRSSVMLRNREAASEVGQLMRNPESAGRTAAEKRRLKRAWSGTKIKVNKAGSGPRSRKGPEMPPGGPSTPGPFKAPPTPPTAGPRLSAKPSQPSKPSKPSKKAGGKPKKKVAKRPAPAAPILDLSALDTLEDQIANLPDDVRQALRAALGE